MIERRGFVCGSADTHGCRWRGDGSLEFFNLNYNGRSVFRVWVRADKSVEWMEAESWGQISMHGFPGAAYLFGRLLRCELGWTSPSFVIVHGVTCLAPVGYYAKKYPGDSKPEDYWHFSNGFIDDWALHGRALVGVTRDGKRSLKWPSGVRGYLYRDAALAAWFDEYVLPEVPMEREAFMALLASARGFLRRNKGRGKLPVGTEARGLVAVTLLRHAAKVMGE